MTLVLLLGYDPETVDFSDPALPPGMTAEKVHAGIAVAMKQFAGRAWEAELGMIRPESAPATSSRTPCRRRGWGCGPSDLPAPFASMMQQPDPRWSVS